MGLIVGLLAGVLLALPLVPLLRVTEPAFGQAAAGLMLISVVLFAVLFWSRSEGFQDAPLREVMSVLAGHAIALAPIILAAGVIAALGARTQHR